MTKIISLRKLKKSYSGKCVLDIEKLHVERGKITAIIGPSGSGKTTLLSIMNGMERPDEGSSIFEGQEFSLISNYTPDVIRRMSMIFQKPVMFNSSVYNNISYGLRLRNMDKVQIKERIEEVSNWLGITHLLKQKAVTLSGGEVGRVSVARGMIIRPDLLLMDEPTANLDPGNVSIIEDMIRKANGKYGTTVVIVTHNMFQAKRLAHNIVFMLNGQVVEEGSVNEIFQSPKDQRTQLFISGNMVY